ncbi:MAG: hypothetical protein IT577_15525 [Verrucomicrobiae bacterium]|nr:hypothetical protein [Verrucomicrobiae bacterium]
MSSLVIRLGLAGGRVLRFDLPDDSPLPGILAKVLPETLFLPQPWWFSHSLCFTSIRPEQTHFVHIVGAEPGWRYPLGTDLVEWVAEADFSNEAAVRRLQTKIRLVDEPPGTSVVQFLRLIMADGAAHHFRISGPARPKEERHAAAEKIASLPAFAARHPDGGQMVINLHLAVAWQVMPGAVDAPPGAWTVADSHLE